MGHLFSKAGDDEKTVFLLNKHDSDMAITFPDTAFPICNIYLQTHIS